MTQYHDLALTLALQAEEAAPFLAASDGGVRNAALLALAGRLRKSAKQLIAANKRDLAEAKRSKLSTAMQDRLAVDAKRVGAMADGVEQVAALPDPIGRTLDGWVRPNGLRIRRIRTPLGVVLMIYEARPNVTTDAASLCLKSGNACILRGGREALFTNRALGKIIAAALSRAGLPPKAVQLAPIPDRELIPPLLGMDKHIDLVVPRGGKGLVRTVMEHSRIPVLKHLDGVCHIYVDESADLDMAEAIVLNSKTNRPSTCNAVETLLVHRKAAKAFIPRCFAALAKAGVEIRADSEAKALVRGIGVKAASEDDWRTEYNDLIISVKIVPDVIQAIRHINSYGSGHTDAIVTSTLAAADRFKREVDSSSVMVNAATRWADGFEYGLGAEIGISTDKLHARGPVGLEGLTTYKWLVEGDGQLRQ